MGQGRQGKKWSKNLSLELPHLPPLPLLPLSQSPLPPFAAPPYTGPCHRLLDNRKRLTASSGQIVNLNEETQMNNKSITPNPQQPVDRVPTGQLPSALAELSEAALESAAGVLPLTSCAVAIPWCSYDGDDE